MIAYLIFVLVKVQSVVSGPGTLRVRTVETQSNIVNIHSQMMSIVPRPSGGITQPNCTFVLLLVAIKFEEEQRVFASNHTVLIATCARYGCTHDLQQHLTCFNGRGNNEVGVVSAGRIIYRRQTSTWVTELEKSWSSG